MDDNLKKSPSDDGSDDSPKEAVENKNCSDVNSFSINGENISFESIFSSDNNDNDDNAEDFSDLNKESENPPDLPTDNTDESMASDTGSESPAAVEQDAASDIPDEVEAAAENANDELPAAETDENAEAPDEEPETVPASKKILDGIKGFLAECGFPDMILARFIGIYLIVSGLNIRSLFEKGISAVDMWKDFVKETPSSTGILWITFGFIFLTFLHSMLPKKARILDPLVMLAGTVIFAVSLMWRTNNFYLCIGVIGVSVAFTSYAVGKITRSSFEKFPKWAAALIALTVAGAVTAFVAVTTVAHHRTFGTSTYDFGIFVQMFHSMITDFTAVTTCERDEFLSHFYVHSSFIYYLLAPFYAIFPNENTLLIAQAILAMGGIIPMFLIAKNHNFKGFALVSACFVYIFCAGILAPCYYDFHENAFLPTLLMWLLYAIDKKNYILLYIMSILVCIVKEDAPLYVMCIGMFFFFNEKTKKRFHGIVVTALSGVYFTYIMNWLTKYGDGQMMAASRFGNLTIDPEEGFVGIIKNVLTNPAYFFSLFVKEETLLFFLQVMIPLLFLPFMTKKIHRYLLMIPFIIMNLVVGAGYGYAAKIGYQYIFGPSCLLIYMSVINCEELSPKKKNSYISSAAVASIITAVCLCSGNIRYYENYKEREDHYIALEECLDSVPQDASVVSNTWYMPHIADREEVYILDMNDLKTDPNDENVKTLIDMFRYDFYVLSTGDEITPIITPQLEAAGFTVFSQAENRMIIYVSPEYEFKK